MSTALQHRRGTTAQHSTFTGAEGELTVDTTKKTLVVHDGVTSGGVPLAKENSPQFTGTPTAPNQAAGTRSQALATMQMFADEFAALKSPSGYQKLPSGLIIQWGIASSIGNGAASSVTFPITFPNGYLCALCNPLSPGANTNNYSASISSSPAPSVSAMTISNNSASSGAIAANWLAIGW